ncbi:MAG TPA: dTDP-4-dehydrorhamnose reductase [Anaerolineae bacterium]|nr:dTDP-4-dehydrorhamnose reductase [Anaerolineae bacterium]
MKIAITGSEGQLGRALQAELHAHHNLILLSSREFDITDRANIPRLADLAPDLVIHTAAMTNVDGAARDPVTAFRINAFGTQNVALACQRANAALVYISTNEVFDGTKAAPYLEFDPTHPINVYGKSKLAGEWYSQHLLQKFYIVRTAWLYARGGGKFPDKILELAQRQPSLSVVRDEIGSPTYVPDLAHALAQLIETQQYGIYHLVNAGSCSRYEWAVEILRRANIPRPIKPITLAEYSRASTPPANSALENFAATTLGITLRSWEEALEAYFADGGRRTDDGSASSK